MKFISKLPWIFLILLSVFLILNSFKKYFPLSISETLGFITGAICVMLVVRQSIWNFPVGIANNIFFIILFYSSHLYGDMALQFVYIALACIGWWRWLYGGQDKTELRVTHASIKELGVLLILGILATLGLREYLIVLQGSAPLADALTTVLSLIAQYLLNGKRIENWIVWIIADILYIALYLHKGLFLTAILYALFIGMCVSGFISWRKTIR